MSDIGTVTGLREITMPPMSSVINSGIIVKGVGLEDESLTGLACDWMLVSKELRVSKGRFVGTIGVLET